MNSFTIDKKIKTKIIKALQNQPDRFSIGDNYAGRVYIMSAKNKRQKEKILWALDVPNVELSRADLRYLYAVIAQNHSRKHSYQAIGRYGYEETYDRLNERDPYWKKVKALFDNLGIKGVPSYETAWDGPDINSTSSGGIILTNPSSRRIVP